MGTHRGQREKGLRSTMQSEYSHNKIYVSNLVKRKIACYVIQDVIDKWTFWWYFPSPLALGCAHLGSVRLLNKDAVVFVCSIFSHLSFSFGFNATLLCSKFDSWRKCYQLFIKFFFLYVTWTPTSSLNLPETHTCAWAWAHMFTGIIMYAYSCMLMNTHGHTHAWPYTHVWVSTVSCWCMFLSASLTCIYMMAD